VRAFLKRSGVPADKVADDLTSAIGNTGTAHVGLLLTSMLDQAEPGDVLALTVLSDGAETLLFRATDHLLDARQGLSVDARIANGNDGLSYADFLTWKGQLRRQQPRRPIRTGQRRLPRTGWRTGSSGSPAAGAPRAVLATCRPNVFFAAGVPIFEAYGMTESTAIISANTPGAWRVGTVGRPVPGVEVRIAEDGEVCARSAGVFPGYWHNEAATAQTIVDGWLHTGDLGALDADGFLQITGRKKDIIITSAGKNITPANLENDLRQSSRIAEAVMLGDHRPYPVALIVLEPEQLAVWAEHGETDDDAWVRDEELHGILAVEIDAVNARYSPPERIRAFAVLPAPFTIESGELTPTFKIRRAVVAQHYAQVVDSLYP